MRIFGVVAALAVVAGSGCSLTFQEHLPDRYGHVERTDVPCSTSRRLPWVDVGILGAEVATAAVGIVVSQRPGEHQERGTVIAGVALFAAVWQTASAGNGFRRARECRQVSEGGAPAMTAGR